MRRKLIQLCTCLFLFPAVVQADEGKLSWQSFLGILEDDGKSISVQGKANVIVSDGLQYSVETSWLDTERAIFKRTYPEREVTLGRSGEYFWAFDGKKVQEISPSLTEIILGHQFHAKLLYPKVFMQDQSREIDSSSLCVCRQEKFKDIDDNQVSIHFEKKSLKPRFMVINSTANGEMTFTYGDWKMVEDKNLPFKIEIDHAGRHFTYKYSEIHLGNKKIHSTLLAPYGLLTDEQQLMRLHRNMIDAHIDSDIRLMDGSWGDQVTFVSRGGISKMSGKDASDGLGRSLDRRKHSRYVDMVKPVITLSDDKTLATIMVQVQAEGYGIDDKGKQGAAFSFMSAWTSVFKKKDGKWKMISNASNFK